MFSTRNLLVLSAVSILAGSGCAKQQNSAVNVSHEPQAVDVAMERRDWPQSVAYIPNGGTVAGSTGFAYEPKRNQKAYTYYYADAGVFFVNLVTLPYTVVKDGFGQPQYFPGERTAPTFTGVAPLPAPVAPVESPTPQPEMPAPESPTSPEMPAQPTPPAETPTPTEPPATAPM